MVREKNGVRLVRYLAIDCNFGIPPSRARHLSLEMSSAITFDELESSTDNTLALVLWAKNVRNTALAALTLALLNQVGRTLVNRFSQIAKLPCLSDEQAAELAKKLQEVHVQLDFLLHRSSIIQWRNSVLFASSLRGIEASGDDVADIIEDLIMSCDPKFRSMLVECVRALPSHSAELVERM